MTDCTVFCFTEFMLPNEAVISPQCKKGRVNSLVGHDSSGVRVWPVRL